MQHSSRTRIEIVSSEMAGTYASPTSPAVRAGETIYLSGVVAFDRHRVIVGKGDVAAQARQALANIRSILAVQGGDLADVVHLRIYLVRPDDQAAVREVLSETFREPWPPLTMISVASLAMPELLIEIEPIAVVSAPELVRSDDNFIG